MIHGGDIYSYQQKTGKQCLDFSANINPLGMPQSVRKALVQDVQQYMAYPDVLCRELSVATATMENVPKEYLLFGNGAADIIYRMAYALKPKKALLLAPTFAEYELALRNVNCEIDYYYLKEKDDFCLQEDFINAINNVDIVFVCNPNNPTGAVKNTEFMIKVAQKCKQINALLVVDECFIDFVINSDDYTLKNELSKYDNLIILKAFTKMFAMAGLRLGYCMCSNADILNKIEMSGQPWSVSTPAQIAGVKACEEIDFVKQTVAFISAERDFLTQQLSLKTKKVYKSSTNYILFKADVNIKEKLEQKGVLIRSCSNYIGLDETFFRVAVKNHADNFELIGAIENG